MCDDNYTAGLEQAAIRLLGALHAGFISVDGVREETNYSGNVTLAMWTLEDIIREKARERVKGVANVQAD